MLFPAWLDEPVKVKNAGVVVKQNSYRELVHLAGRD
jgi:hypothetical protein